MTTPSPPPPPPPQLSHEEFLGKALTSANEWARFADPKALAVLVLLGLGLSDLVGRAHRLSTLAAPANAECDLGLVTAHTSCPVAVATSAGLLAALLAVVTVALVTHALFSRLTVRGILGTNPSHGPIDSVFYFGDIARAKSQAAYQVRLRGRTPEELFNDVAGQVYEISVIAATKHRATQRAYVAVVCFLILWAITRISLAAS